MANRWSPTVLPEVPRMAGMELANGASQGLQTFNDMQAMREKRRAQEVEEQQRSRQLDQTDRRITADKEELDYNRGEALRQERNRFIAMGASIDDGTPIVGNAQPGSTVANGEASQKLSDTETIRRRAMEMFPVKPVTIDGPNGQKYRLDGNRAARDEYMGKAGTEIDKRLSDEQKFNRDKALEEIRQAGRLKVEQERGKYRAKTAGRGGPPKRDDGITPTQSRSAWTNAQSTLANLAGERGRIAKYVDDGSDEYDVDRAAGWKRDSTMTVDRFRPENNPAMAAAVEDIGGGRMPRGTTPFFEPPLNKQEVVKKMGELTILRDRAKNPAERQQAQQLLDELASQVNERKWK